MISRNPGIFSTCRTSTKSVKHVLFWSLNTFGGTEVRHCNSGGNHFVTWKDFLFWENLPWKILVPLFSSWWLNQPIWKICSSIWIISPNRGENTKYLKPPTRFLRDANGSCMCLWFLLVQCQKCGFKRWKNRSCWFLDDNKMCLRDTPPFVPKGPQNHQSLSRPVKWRCFWTTPRPARTKGSYSRCLAVPIQHNMVPPPKNLCQILPWKFKIAPENRPSQKESRLTTINFSGAMLNFGGVMPWTKRKKIP